MLTEEERDMKKLATVIFTYTKRTSYKDKLKLDRYDWYEFVYKTWQEILFVLKNDLIPAMVKNDENLPYTWRNCKVDIYNPYKKGYIPLLGPNTKYPKHILKYYEKNYILPEQYRKPDTIVPEEVKNLPNGVGLL